MTLVKNKAVIVTGAGSGIGREIVIQYCKAGAKVLAADIQESSLQTLVDEIKASSSSEGAIEIMKVNVSVQAEVEAMVDRAFSVWGKLDVLINNAGIMDNMSGVGELSVDLWNKVLAVNLNGPMYAMHHAVPLMVAQGGGSIINIGSVASFVGSAAGAAYTASKHAIAGLTRNTAFLYAKKGIRCNAVCPGGTQTNIHTTMGNLDQQAFGTLQPYMNVMPGMMMPKDIADVVLLLGTDLAASINGQVIACDKGWTCC
jgi:NAD(P)-dependent dehydrogenase (short-subunit alcohol dehydrogenase family)